ncbi:response regulator transcription factor [Myroides odoratus]|uniref:Transcriptional regulatory protein CssR n=1 Tax=Myroides odoratus TaxID=256 RepID=A0A378RNT7_MYROD|nr:response regulator transcription factor [Myroides odoratus]MCS4240239.1 DNA-binding response OmpR family regulator [Myroides odoratus]MDH6602835.1 DNA-binding response OmpR family regulator [Myroides gitamensis]QQU03942.1 response regulator transcription factor [Myroides odoratus]STZ28676.1 Transcriptional regulatory protein CssR [Myroides odoratus]
MHNILLVEDDIDYGTVVKQYLEISGFNVIWTPSSTEVAELLQQHHFHLAILDIMLPIKDGFTLAKEIHQNHPNIPFLFLTAKNQNIDRLLGLKLGAADYIAKTCDPEELKLRIDNIMRHTPIETSTVYHLGIYSFNPTLLRLEHAKKVYQLTERERDLLLLFIQHDQSILEREVILNQLWQTADYFNGRSLDVFVTRLRKYLSDDDNIQISSIRGVGFKINLAR